MYQTFAMDLTVMEINVVDPAMDLDVVDPDLVDLAVMYFH